MGIWETPKEGTKDKDDPLLCGLREIRNQKGSRIAAVKPILDSLMEFCGWGEAGYNWNEAQCAAFFRLAILQYLQPGYDRELLLASSGYGAAYEKITSSATARRRAFYEAHPRLKNNGDPLDIKSLEKSEEKQLLQLTKAMREAVRDGTMIELLFKVFTEAELRDLGLEALADKLSQHERALHTDGASLKTEKIIRSFNISPVRFSGRQKELKEIEDNFRNGTYIQILSGVAGQGKSALAFEYARLHSDAHPILCWINCSDEMTIIDSIISFFRYAQVTLQDYSPDRVRHTFLKFFDENTDWLIIFDNPVLTITKQQQALERYLPQGHNGHILITARASLELWGGSLLDMGVMTEPERISALKDAFGDKSRGPYLDNLAKCLGAEPVALEYAATFIQEAKWATPSIYLQLLAERNVDLAESQGESPGCGDQFEPYYNVLSATFDILMGHLHMRVRFQNNTIDTALLEFLTMSPYISAGGKIDLLFLSQILPVFPKELTTVCQNDEKRKQLIQALKGYAFLEVEDGILLCNERSREVAYRYFIDRRDTVITDVANAMETALVTIDRNQYINQDRVYIQAAYYTRMIVGELAASRLADDETLQSRYPHMRMLYNYFYL